MDFFEELLKNSQNIDSKHPTGIKSETHEVIILSFSSEEKRKKAVDMIMSKGRLKVRIPIDRD